jgi:hypothetical protein
MPESYEHRSRLGDIVVTGTKGACSCECACEGTRDVGCGVCEAHVPTSRAFGGAVHGREHGKKRGKQAAAARQRISKVTLTRDGCGTYRGGVRDERNVEKDPSLNKSRTETEQL